MCGLDGVGPFSRFQPPLRHSGRALAIGRHVCDVKIVRVRQLQHVGVQQGGDFGFGLGLALSTAQQNSKRRRSLVRSRRTAAIVATDFRRCVREFWRQGDVTARRAETRLSPDGGAGGDDEFQTTRDGPHKHLSHFFAFKGMAQNHAPQWLPMQDVANLLSSLAGGRVEVQRVRREREKPGRHEPFRRWGDCISILSPSSRAPEHLAYLASYNTRGASRAPTSAKRNDQSDAERTAKKKKWGKKPKRRTARLFRRGTCPNRPS